MKKVYFISSNEGKQREVFEMLGSELEKYNAEIVLRDLTTSELQGNGEELIRDKTSQAVSTLNEIVVCEDSALCFHAVGDLPGIYM